ncbi:eukaryotic translation initiation factor SUI1 family protein [Mycena belliarum]|uniref:Eukaryotic translation initiation factor SUI1 family protein n=1 Tax=Mycena belliarum TaxID=1033014 RepID=A0AAD6TU21_9AGAR|nr:eukaryotic translation initiation factor SUI1 family protein [Mycena belliae]
MFKKPFSAKTSAPLRSSDRRKLKQRVVAVYSLSSEDGDVVVPEGILSVKFTTHLDELGIAYLSPDGDPLWFSLGKGSEDLIPSVYTMWKRPKILPFLSTPAAVIPVLVGGADLMIPGVVHHTPSLKEGQLVSISQYTHGETPTLSSPLAVGRMALSSDEIQDGRQEKGKAVYILHTWKDHLWDMGSKPDMPEPTPFSLKPELVRDTSSPSIDEGQDESSLPIIEEPPVPEDAALSTASTYTPNDISTLLHSSLLQALSTVLSELPATSFPMSASTFFEAYVLPYRPALPNIVLPNVDESLTPQEITIKNSGHKSLTAFLKSVEKVSLLTLKAPPKHGQQTELAVTSVNAKHPSVAGHRSYVTVKDIETKVAKKAKREERLKEAEQASGRWVEVKELWKPHLKSVELIEAFGGSARTMYEVAEVRAMLNDYIAAKGLVNPREQAYINLDTLLSGAIAPKVKKGEAPPATVEFMKRDDLTKSILEQMQSWYEVKVPSSGKEPIIKKGALRPVQVAVKIRQGRKACTVVSGFEPFLVLSGDEMAEDLRKLCAGATSVSPRVGGTPGLEVLVQGKQAKVVVDYLTEKGIPKKWIEVSDLVSKK